ncbi:HTH domain-containing protein [Peribacillus muralis]|uniref:helix-turn-helix domain-containing protein n=1 Tax=Peribacillus muralis TaxID=264697 RepID=UPI001F4D6E79|nr:helix-turn-helix domain-containing protein [Peribacillus muralis]MCK1993164.1 helix-turn-helix domain-containing protein [Peribacillus muralis]MCK2013718.1 helix-turn-helix domain-containing protein [Peribacillus muralis]
MHTGSTLPPEWKIERNEVQGVRLIKPKNGTIEELWFHLKSENTYFQTLELILFNKGVTIKNITQHVHVSRSTVYRQLEKIEEVVKSAGVRLTNSPYKIVGDEKKIRRFIMQYVEYMSGDINDFIATFDLKEFQETVLTLLKEYKTSLHMGAIQRLAIILHISNIRISHNCFVTIPKAVIEENEKSKAFEIAKELFPFMEKAPIREKQIQEIFFFSLYLMSEEMSLNRTQELRYIRSRLNSESGKPLSDFLGNLSREIGLDVSQDDIFMYEFAQTLRGINFDLKLKTDTRINNILQFVPYFKENPLFGIIEKIGMNLLGEFSVSFENIEILEIFMLVQASILRKKNQMVIETALVCRSYVEKDYIREVLKHHFGNQLNIYVMDFSDIDSLFRKNVFDLLITTDLGQLINIEHIPIYKVSSFPTPSELKEIKMFTRKNFIDRYGLNPEILYPFEDDID